MGAILHQKWAVNSCIQRCCWNSASRGARAPGGFMECFNWSFVQSQGCTAADSLEQLYVCEVGGLLLQSSCCRGMQRVKQPRARLPEVPDLTNWKLVLVQFQTLQFQPGCYPHCMPESFPKPAKITRKGEREGGFGVTNDWCYQNTRRLWCRAPSTGLVRKSLCPKKSLL